MKVLWLSAAVLAWIVLASIFWAMIFVGDDRRDNEATD